MTFNSMKGMSLVTLEEFSSEQIKALLSQAIKLKSQKMARIFPRSLTNRNFALILMQPSLRTQSAFAVAAADEGAVVHTMYPYDIRFGFGESVKDIAIVLGKLFDGIAIRAPDSSVVRELAEYANIPVWNALTSHDHPTQILADLMTLQENNISLEGAKVAYVADGKANVAASLIVAATKIGLDLRIITPYRRFPEESLIHRLVNSNTYESTKITVTSDMQTGLRGADVVYSDMWVPIKKDFDVERAVQDFQGYQINEKAMMLTENPNSLFFHCMPAQHNFDTVFAGQHPMAIETTDEVFYGKQSRVMAQAENKMHTFKALMLATVQGKLDMGQEL